MVKVKLRSVPWAVNADDRIVSKSKNTFTGTRTRSRRRIVRRYFWSLAFAVCVSLAALLVNWFYPDRGDVPRSFLKHCSGGLNQLRQQQPVLGTSTAKEKQQSSEPVRQQAVACRYHGNCPEATACSSRGLCLPYYLHQYTHRHYPTDKNATAPTAEDISHELCVQTCVRELTVEEGFQYGSIPVVQWTSVAAAPHLGCVVNFRRERRLGGLDNWSERPSMAFRIAQRWRSVARIDFSGQRDHWTALCNQPCITDQDCPEHGLACLGRRAYEPPPKLPRGANRTFAKNCQTKTLLDRDMLVVTGADHLYYEPLRNFAASLRYWAPARKLVIYNLGMSESELQHVQSWPNVHAIHWKDGFPSSLPSHVVDNLHNYAWKSLVINETVHEYKSIFWLDAGVTLVGPIEPIEEITHQHGLFLVKGQDGNMTSTSHPGKPKLMVFWPDFTGISAKSMISHTLTSL
jgi:hypothetical protein